MPGPDVFEAIASPVRRALLDVLAGGARSVHDLAAPFEMTHPAGCGRLSPTRRFWPGG